MLLELHQLVNFLLSLEAAGKSAQVRHFGNMEAEVLVLCRVESLAKMLGFLSGRKLTLITVFAKPFCVVAMPVALSHTLLS